MDGPEFESRRRLLWGWRTKLKPYCLLQHVVINNVINSGHSHGSVPTQELWSRAAPSVGGYVTTQSVQPQGEIPEKKIIIKKQGEVSVQCARFLVFQKIVFLGGGNQLFFFLGYGYTLLKKLCSRCILVMTSMLLGQSCYLCDTFYRSGFDTPPCKMSRIWSRRLFCTLCDIWASKKQ